MRLHSSCEIRIENDPVTAQDEDRALDAFNMDDSYA
jgi:hypothetical protein